MTEREMVPEKAAENIHRNFGCLLEISVY